MPPEMAPLHEANEGFLGTQMQPRLKRKLQEEAEAIA